MQVSFVGINFHLINQTVLFETAAKVRYPDNEIIQNNAIGRTLTKQYLRGLVSYLYA